MPDRCAATEMTYTGTSSDSSYGLLMSSPSFVLISCWCCWCCRSRYSWRARRSRSSRGSASEVAMRRSSSADRAFLFRSCGTTTSTVASSAPSVPSLRRTPRPATRNACPFGVPGGTRTVTAAPRCVGTLISAPSASSGIVTGTVTVRFSPARPNTACGVTWTRTYRSPGLPPCSPGAPPRGEARLNGARAHPAPAAAARRARVLDYETAAAAGFAGLGETEPAEVTALLPGATAVRTDLRHRAGLGAGPVTDGTRPLAGEPQRYRGAVDRVAERHIGPCLAVRPASRPAPPPPP